VNRSLLLIAVATAACGSDPPDITGLYMTTSHEASDTACTGGTTPDGSPPYFRIEEREVLGVAYRTRTNCQDTTPGSCSGGGGLLVEETDDGYRGEAYIAGGDESACTLVYSSYDAALDGDELSYENVNYSESGAIAPCTTDEAEARGDEMPCTSYEMIVGIRAGE
jgi:hypothetical protein